MLLGTTPVFKRISIELTGPICNCESQHLVFGIVDEEDGKVGLYLLCSVCGTKLNVPHKKFVGRFVLDTPYPADNKPNPPEPSPPPTPPDSNVIPFDPNRRKTKKRPSPGCL